MDMRRNPRDFAAAFGLVNGSLVIAPKLDRFAFTTGEAIDIKVAVAAGDHRFPGGVLACGGQSVAVPRIAPAGVAALPPLKVSPPRAPGRHQIALTLTDAKGRVATRSFVEVTVLSRRSVPATRIWASSEELRGRFEALGYKIARQADAQVLVTERLDDDADRACLARREAVAAGRRRERHSVPHRALDACGAYHSGPARHGARRHGLARGLHVDIFVSAPRWSLCGAARRAAARFCLRAGDAAPCLGWLPSRRLG